MSEKALISVMDDLKISIYTLNKSVEKLTESVNSLNGTHESNEKMDTSHEDIAVLKGTITDLIKSNGKLIESIQGLRFG